MIDQALAFAEAGFPIIPIRREQRQRMACVGQSLTACATWKKKC